ncbi:asparagine synthetase B family protein [Microbispora sp. RL4-1S]|uniref:Asparagine synthetase B family protein n=1 Tax=Microbispora oryzae TaxID=2806554 RepID=A0A940WQN1_9ACTN|nr:asparagine synthetase B family protein [Microbispora oryzae]MBP2705174.1 asparagine synthetase B family protein [Microbispora oryzae]
MRKGEWPRFQARPYVCGAIGPFDEARLDLLARSGPAVRPVHTGAGVALLASAPLAPYSPGGEAQAAARPGSAGSPETGGFAGVPGDGVTRAFAWGDRRPAATAPGDAVEWVAIAEAYETPGLVDEPDAVTLHTGGFGLVDVYYLADGDAVYFSGLIEPLLALARRPYEVNWRAWAAILTLTYPLLEDTPYAEVKRLPGATALTWSRDERRLRLDRRAPRWVREEPVDRGVTGADLVELLHEALAPYDRLLVPVSGGYDSRLLASVATSRGIDVESWTTSPDDGLDNDIDFARYITRELGIPHRIIPQDAARFPDEALWAARRLEYLTSHHAWYSPFAREVHAAGRPVVDGLAGGPLMKNFLITSDAVAAGTGASRRTALLGSLTTGEAHIPVLGEPAGAWMDDQVREVFTAATSMLHGHRAELPLSVLHTRTVRGIARSPVNLVGPETAPVFPFLHPPFFDAALSVPVDRKEGGRFYREILHAANPRVAALPSTNGALPHRRVPLRSAGPVAREWNHRMLVRAAAIPGLLSPQMLDAVAGGPDALTAFGSWNSRFWLRGLAVFGAWLGDYEDLLGDLTPPWAARTVATPVR